MRKSSALKQIGIATVVALTLLPTGSATAHGSLNAGCQFDGLSGAGFTPVHYLANSGTFQFSANARCVVVHNAVPDVLPNLTLSANGTFDNLICGTGTFTGTFTRSPVMLASCRAG